MFQVHAYELLNFFPEDIQYYDLEQMKSEIDSNYSFIQKCNKVEVFTKNKNSNLKGNSLRVLSSSNEEFIITENGIDLKNKCSVPLEVRQTYKIIKFLLKKSKSFEKLFKLVSEGQYKTVIRAREKSLNRAAPDLGDENTKACNVISSSILTFYTSKKIYSGVLERCPKEYQIGSDSIVYWGYNNYPDKKKNIIALAHELYHAYDISRGLLDQRMIKDDILANAAVAEFRGVYFENLVRKDLGYPLRESYGDNGTLVIDGQPVWMQLPCIKKRSFFKRIFPISRK